MLPDAQLSELAALERGEVAFDTELTYDGMTPVRLHVSKRDHRYEVSDGGGAVSAAGAEGEQVAFPERIPLGYYEANVSRHGVVSLPAVSPTETWLRRICELVARGSVVLYEHLLDDEPSA